MRPYETVLSALDDRAEYGLIIIDGIYFYVYKRTPAVYACDTCGRKIDGPITNASIGAVRKYGKNHWCADCMDDLVVLSKLGGAEFKRLYGLD